MALWSSAKELIRGEPSVEPGLDLDSIRTKIYRPGLTALERRHLFETITSPFPADQFLVHIVALAELTKDGKDVATFESDILPLVARWLNYWFRTSSAIRKKGKERERGAKAHELPKEELCLNHVYEYTTNLLRFNFNAFREQDVCTLLEQLLYICKKTTASSDIKNSVQMVDALVTYGDIPRPMLERCLDVLCGAYGTLKDLSEPVWSTINNLCKSHSAQNTVTALLDILRSPSGHCDRNTNTLRGAFILLKRLWQANGAHGLATFSTTALLSALQLVLAANSARLELEILETILNLLRETSFTGALDQEDSWSILANVLAECSQKTTEKMKATSSGSADNDPKTRETASKSAECLNKIVLVLEDCCLRSNFSHRQTLMDFFLVVSHRLPNTTAELLVKFYVDEHLCYPSSPGWLADSKHLIKCFMADQARPVSVRMQVLEEMSRVYDLVEPHLSPALTCQFVNPILAHFQDETDGQVLESLKAFALKVADHPDKQASDLAIGALARCISPEFSPNSTIPSAETDPVGSGPAPHASYAGPLASEAAVATLTSIFIRALDSSALKVKEGFFHVLRAAHSRQSDSPTRIAALQLLFRLRSDAANAIYLAPVFDSECLAAALGRTAEFRDNSKGTQDCPRSRQSRQEPRMINPSSKSPPFAPQPTGSSTTSRSSGSTLRSSRRRIFWVYQEEFAKPDEAPRGIGNVVGSSSTGGGSSSSASGTDTGLTLKIKLWLETLISILQQEDDWEVYSYVVVHLPSQLTNHSLFMEAVPQIQMLRSVLCEQLRNGSVREPPASAGIKKSDILACLFQALAILLTYHQSFSKNEQDEIVRTFLAGIGSGERTTRYCIHALAVCCHELPLSISKSLNGILQKMSQVITQSQIAIHILEFLAGLARLPEVYVNFREEDYRTVFGVSFRYLQYVRDQREKGAESALIRSSVGPDPASGIRRESGVPAEASLTSSAANDLPQYVYALAYQVITFWFLSVKLVDRPKYTSWITKNLVLTDATGREVIDEQSLVTIDLMQRVAYSDHDETLPDPRFAGPAEETIAKKSWLLGMSIVTIETALRSGKSQITKRQPSATTHWTYLSRIAQRPLHQIPISSNTITDAHEEASLVAVLPNHILLQMASSSWRTPASMRSIPLPDDDATQRAISMFDRNSTVDGHKVGVIYVAEGQTDEAEILANTHGSNDFTEFLTELGILTRLKGARFNTQGLDREMDSDGEFTFAWRDRVTEMVFHIPVMMPTDKERDPRCVNKKRHTGNDFVNIIFNNSGLPFRFDTFPSEFNYVNIVIAPEARASTARVAEPVVTEPHQRFYKVQVVSQPDFPQISPAAETKVLSGRSLPAFVRQIALHASVFCLVWANREGGEHVSSWRNRLREITRLREKHTPTTPSNVTSPGPTPASAGGISAGGGMGGQRESLGFRRTSGPGFFASSGDGLTSQRSSIFSTATTATETDPGGFVEGESLADGYDFSKWAA